MFRRFALVLAFASFCVPGVSCGPAKSSCLSAGCQGCCDSSGACSSGALAASCGGNGLSCEACLPGQVCQGGACVAGNGAPCSPASCAGCCSAAGTCAPGAAVLACGVNGQACTACGASQRCSELGLCQDTSADSGTDAGSDAGAPVSDAGSDAGRAADGGADAGSCGVGTCAGCCASGTCLLFGAQSPAQCGLGGGACQGCGADSCQSGVCTPVDAGVDAGADAGVDAGSCGSGNCAGCCAGTQCIAVGGQTNGQCGTLGATCSGCTGSLVCTNGSCQPPPCGVSNCPLGCCSGNTCIAQGNQGTGQCGTGGVSCVGCPLGDLCQGGGCAVAVPTVTVLASGSRMPPVWVQPNAQPFASSGDGGASLYIGQLAQVNETVTTSHGGGTDPQCPLPFGTNTCDGFDVSDGTSTAVVDSFNYLGKAGETACGMPPADGTQYPRVTGVWEDHYNSQARTDTWVLALSTCAGAGGGGPDAGNATIPPPTTDIHAALVAGLMAGQAVQLRGVVVGRWNASTSSSFGFSMEDPDGGAQGGMHVYNSPDAGIAGSFAPKLGDYVQVTGLIKLYPTDGGPTFPEIDL